MTLPSVGDRRSVESGEETLGTDTGATRTPKVGVTPVSGCLVRLAWLGANVGMLVMAAVIARDGHGPISVASGVFWATAIAVIGLRQLDIKNPGGRRSSEQRATGNDFRSYALWVLFVAFGLWQIALFLG